MVQSAPLPLASNSQETGKLHDWSIPDLPEKTLVKQAGIELYQFPCLKDQGRYVEQSYCSDQVLADKLHRMGVSRLLCFRLEATINLFKKQEKCYAYMALLFAPVGKAEALFDDFIMAAVANHFFHDQEVPRSKLRFENCYAEKRGDFYDALVQFGMLVEDILRHFHELMKQLKGKMNLALAMPMTDLQHQLTHLVYPGFLSDTPLERLKSFPRYLQACAVRLEKMPRDMANERRFVPLLTEWWKNYEARFKKFEAQGIVDPELENFRWLLEEQRVSWYAQHLGTQETVSEKRLNKVWESIRR